MKTYRIRENIGKCRYCVNFHDGVKTHNDGSEFFDLHIFSNKRKMTVFVNKLKRDGYVEAGYVKAN